LRGASLAIDRHENIWVVKEIVMRARFGGWATGMIASLTAVLAYRKLDDFDTWWHLAAGRWIAGHAAVPSTDTLSHTVRDHPWIDLQWGFDVAIYLLHAAGGPVLLCLAGAAGFSLAAVLLFRLVRPHLGDVPGAGLVILALLAAQERFAVRPEMLSFPLLMGVLAVLERARISDGRGSWRLVPLMIVWANVHALFVIGVFAIACALADERTRRPRRLVMWGCASVAAVLVNPYGLRGALFPLKLLSRIDGSSPAFQTIAEFRSPFGADAGGMAVAAYKLLLVLGIGAVLSAFVLNFRRKAGLGLGGLIYFAGLAGLSAAARRNGALFAFGCTPLIARSLGTALDAVPEALRARARRHAGLGAAAVASASVLIGVSVITGAFYRWDRQPREFGGGVIEGVFPVRAAAFVREAKLPGTLYNDEAAGGYLAWADPTGSGVFIDGRLEVYDTAFFSDYVAAMYDQTRWQADADRYGVETAIVFHHWENRRRLVERLVRGGDWSLVYADEVAAVFVRVAGNDQALARAASLNDRWNGMTREWLERPVAAWPYPAGRVEGTLAFARLLATVDDAEGAVEAYTKLLELGVPRDVEIETRLILARRFSGTGRLEQARDQARHVLALDPRNQDAQALAR
jgi:hypothetical protein